MFMSFPESQEGCLAVSAQQAPAPSPSSAERHQRAALLEIKASFTNFDALARQYDWEGWRSSSAEPCTVSSWTFVSCSEAGLVTGLNISDVPLLEGRSKGLLVNS